MAECYCDGRLGIMFLLISFSVGQELCRDKFPNCNCTDISVVCVGESLPDVKTLFREYPGLRKTVQRMEVHGATFQSMTEDFFCSDPTNESLVSLTNLNLASNNITEVYNTTFECIPNIETLILANNQWEVARNDTELGIGFFNSMANLKQLNLTNSFQYVWNGTVYVSKISKLFYQTTLNSLVDLDMSFNEFNSFSVYSANTLCGMPALKRLNMSHNNLSEPAMPNSKDCFQNLEVLDLSWNKMENLREQFTEQLDQVFEKYGKLLTVLLDGNPFICDCWLRMTWHWLNVTKSPVNKHQLKCTSRGNPSLKDGETYYITELNPDDLNCKGGLEPSSVFIKVITGVIFTVLGIAIVVCIYLNRAKLLKLCNREKRDSGDRRYRYSRAGTENEQLC